MGQKWERYVIQTRDVKSAWNSGGQCTPWFLDDESDDESASLPLTMKGGYHCGGCRSAEEAARFELTEPLRKSIGEAATGEGGS